MGDGSMMLCVTPTPVSLPAPFQVAANLRAHTLLSMRNCRPEEWTLPQLTHYVSLFTFLNARHTWNLDLLSLPEPELFEVRALPSS